MFCSVVQPRGFLFPTVSALSSDPGGTTAMTAAVGGKLLLILLFHRNETIFFEKLIPSNTISFASVPIIFNKLCERILQSVQASGGFYQSLFDTGFLRRSRRYSQRKPDRFFKT